MEAEELALQKNFRVSSVRTAVGIHYARIGRLEEGLAFFDRALSVPRRSTQL
jgi:hypothetical protein